MPIKINRKTDLHCTKEHDIFLQLGNGPYVSAKKWIRGEEIGRGSFGVVYQYKQLNGVGFMAVKISSEEEVM